MNSSFPRTTHLVKFGFPLDYVSCISFTISSSPNSQSISLMLTLTSSIFLLSIYHGCPVYQEGTYATSNPASHMNCLADYHLHHYLKYHQQRHRESCPSLSFSNNASKGISLPLLTSIELTCHFWLSTSYLLETGH